MAILKKLLVYNFFSVELLVRQTNRSYKMRILKYIIAAILIITTVSPCLGNEAKCRQIAQREYPNDPKMQNYVHNKQISAARYMATVTDQDVKNIALREYPEDFSMQKYVYDKQSSAKRYTCHRLLTPM